MTEVHESDPPLADNGCSSNAGEAAANAASSSSMLSPSSSPEDFRLDRNGEIVAANPSDREDKKKGDAGKSAQSRS
eukprot:CAMPEP_0197443868 /NCGR_PEP_ID=MMETSP1175-20131217/9500_1 /TAXON_ID=1003142 /ORGANISM="Triceratium dubium, Strain CCMP147" /LENGTH=75 /DNA_ID=CAMNT_0042974561 /DNA_START=59 /DNA_END=282 /DNA_ORIENTATION=-